MRNIKLTIEYDGTDFCGWQLQPNGITVQEVINKALSKIEGREINVNGAGRTDAGVHARGQVANFMTESRIPAEKYRDAINSLLPDTVRVRESAEVPEDFHPRFSAKKKTYKYYIRSSCVMSPLKNRYEYYVSGKLDTEKMEKAAKFFIGEHDFMPFMASGSAVKDTVRTIYNAEITVNGEEIVYTVCGNGFLYKMVRLMVGTLVEIGRGKYEPEYIAKLLSDNTLRATVAAPARGLVMESIEYDIGG